MMVVCVLGLSVYEGCVLGLSAYEGCLCMRVVCV